MPTQHISPISLPCHVIKYGYSMQPMQVRFYKEVKSMAFLPENSYPP